MILFAVPALHGVTVVGLNLGSPLSLDVVARGELGSTARGILSMVPWRGHCRHRRRICLAGWLIDRLGVDLLYLICGVGALALGKLGGGGCIQRPVPEIRSMQESNTIA